MFCPKCSGPLAAGVQYCQRCGLAVEGVRSLVLEGGGEEGAGAGGAPRRRGYGQGFKLLLLAALLLLLHPLAELLFGSLIPGVENSRLDELPMELFNAALLILSVCGVARLLYARLFERGEAAPAAEDAAEGGGAERLFAPRGGRALPHARSTPAADYFGSRVDTADLAAPRSVTEHTTRSLRND
jgi:hypothetical protein